MIAEILTFSFFGVNIKVAVDNLQDQFLTFEKKLTSSNLFYRFLMFVNQGFGVYYVLMNTSESKAGGWQVNKTKQEKKFVQISTSLFNSAKRLLK